MAKKSPEWFAKAVNKSLEASRKRIASGFHLTPFDVSQMLNAALAAGTINKDERKAAGKVLTKLSLARLDGVRAKLSDDDKAVLATVLPKVGLEAQYPT